MVSVCVLLSTYNGEAFLREQLDSLFAQEDVELTILARDDGSSDGTTAILAAYAEQHPNLRFFCGSNCGPARSFFTLMEKAPEADYYAFCDQDDVWDPDKLKIAVGMLAKADPAAPNVYHYNLRIVDRALHFYRLSHARPYAQKTKYSVLTEDCATGCTIVFNRTAEELLRHHIPAYFSMHDSWVYLVCRFFGTAIYDFDAHISYRQHGDNAIGTYLGRKTKDIYLERFHRLFNRELQPRYNNARSFYEEFGFMLNEKDRKKVLKLVRYKDSLPRRLSLLFDTEIHASDLSREIRYRGLILLGIV